MVVKPKVNLILDTIILMLFVAALVSGLLLAYVYPHGEGGYRGGRGAAISASQTEVLGISRSMMDDLHLYSSLVASGLVALHLVFHWKWIVCQYRRLTQSAPHVLRRSRGLPGG